MIHRAIFGSFERFIGILLEHTEGNLPTWLSPIQAVVINVGGEQKDYAKKIFELLKTHGIRVELKVDNETVGKRIREAEIQKIPYILVVGDKEMANKTVNVRHYKKGQLGEIELEKLLADLKSEIETKK